ncbi:3234_t:CDS:2 [Dentiscutata heterogama]|uniref:3234_t:CDS:1 n=1 Tax=Dentiscutata heterogama TaxID=1316150 RepID=A0ACA9MWJ2_9GLOM|nr:3234_t:CDS:2 [Dentiscutata heterogama]
MDEEIDIKVLYKQQIFFIKMFSFELILRGLELSLKDFIKNHLPITSNYKNVKTFDEFLDSSNDRIINERKGEILDYFIHQFLLKNGIISCINKTLVYINPHNMPRISDGNVDLHGQYKILIFLIQITLQGMSYEAGGVLGTEGSPQVDDIISVSVNLLNPGAKIMVRDIREFLNTVRNKPESNIGFFVSNVELSEYAYGELQDSEIKDRICSEIKKIKEDKHEKYEESIEKLHKKIEKLENQNFDLEKKIENQDRKLDLILSKLK